MEFKLINPQNENGFVQSIEFNFEELKTELECRLEKYNNLTYSENQIKEAKEDRAGLNKFKEAIEIRRKEIKQLCLKPYNEFEEKVKQLVTLVDKPILAIDTQLKTFEEQRITAKTTDIHDFYEYAARDLKELLPLDIFFNQKWLNATYKIEKIQKEIIEKIGEVNGNLKVISDLNLDSDMQLQVKDKYLQTLDFGAAMAEKTRLENLKNAFKRREIVQDKIYTEQPNEENEQEITAEIKTETQEQAKIYTRKFWVKGTKEKLQALGKYLKANNIEYGGIE